MSRYGVLRVLRPARAFDSSAVIPAGKHLFPFRTEKLSLPGPMVLGGQPPGRVGRRRFSRKRARKSGPFFVVRNTAEMEIPRPDPPLEDDVIRLRPWTLDDVPAGT